MARENFFDGYLLKKLRFLNKAMEPWGTYDRVTGGTLISCQGTLTLPLALATDIDDSAYDLEMKKQSDTKWTFDSSVTLPESYDCANLNGWSGEAWANSKASVKNVIEFEPGSDLVTVSGTTHFEYTYKFVDKHIFKSDDVHEKQLVFDITWSLSLDLEAVEDGDLQILAIFADPSIQYRRQDLAGSFNAARNLKNQVENAVKETKNLKNALAQDLANKQGIVLPAAGVFFFKNPILSWRGDLICSVAYSTIVPKKMMDPNDKTKINKDGVARATF